MIFFQEEIKIETLEILFGFIERNYIEVQTLGYDKNHVYILDRFLPKYSESQVIRLIMSITTEIFSEIY